jgi:hypothetical protein
MPTFWHLEFWGASWSSAKSVHPCRWIIPFAKDFCQWPSTRLPRWTALERLVNPYNRLYEWYWKLSCNCHFFPSMSFMYSVTCGSNSNTSYTQSVCCFYTPPGHDPTHKPSDNEIKCLVYSAKDWGFKWPPITFRVLSRQLQATDFAASRRTFFTFRVLSRLFFAASRCTMTGLVFQFQRVNSLVTHPAVLMHLKTTWVNFIFAKSVSLT